MGGALCCRRGAELHLEDDGWQCSLVVTILVGLGLRLLLPVLLVRLQGLPQPPCDIRLQPRRASHCVCVSQCVWHSVCQCVCVRY